MKKLFVCLLILIVCFAGLVACGDETETTAPETSSTAPVSSSAPTSGDEPAKSGLEDAKAYLEALYKESGESTPVDYELIGALRVDGVSYTLEWSVGEVTGVTVTRKDATTVLIDVIDRTDVDIPYTLTATITDADGKSIKVDFTKKVPKFKENTFADYAAAEKGDLLIVKGVVSGIIAKSKGNTANCIYVQDVDGGYYVYGLEKDPVTELKLEIGMTVRVTGTMDIYNGTLELKDASVEILNEGAKTDVKAKDLTDAYKAATDLKAKELVGIQGMYVTLKGVTIGELGDNGYHYFTLGNHTSYVRISSSTCPLTKDEQTAFTSGWSSHLGWTADIAGVISVYDGKFYLTPCVPSDVNFVSLPELDDAGKVAFEKGNLSLVDKIKEAGEITVPTAGVSYTGVTISWASDNACITVNGGKLVVTLPTADATVKVTATIKSGDVTDTKEFEVKVVAPAKVVYTPEWVDAPVVGTAYKFGFTANGTTYYFNGGMNSQGYYFGVTTTATEAVDVYLEAAEGGYKFYFLEGTTKKYLEIYLSGTYVNCRISDNGSVFSVDATTKAWVTTLGDNVQYIGTYSNDKGVSESIRPSKIDYITGDNASKIGVTQFLAQFCTLKAEEAGATEPKLDTAPVVGKAYKLGFAFEGTMYYLNGALNSQGYYFAITDDVAEAVDFYLEAVEGGFKLYYLDGETKQYLEAYLSGTYVNMRYSANGSVFSIDATTKAWVTTINDTVQYLGTYTGNNGLNESVRLSKIDYITGDNASKIGVSQFLAQCFEMVASEGGNEPEAPETPAEPDLSVNGTPLAGFPYNVVLTQKNLGKLLYLTGALNGRTLATTDDPALAAQFYVEASGDGYAFYMLNGTKKSYVEVYLNGDNLSAFRFSDTATVFTYNSELKAWVCELDGVAYFLGNTGMYGDVYACLASFLTAESAGTKQFAAILAPTDGLSEVKAGYIYKFGLYQTKLDKMLFVTGKVDGRYLATTENPAEAADVFAEKATDGYKFFIFEGAAKKYIDVYFNADNKLSVQFGTEGDVFAYDATTKAWVTTVDETTYYLGTYNTFNTVSASKTSYINADNTGVEQFPCGFYTLTSDEPVEISIPVFKEIAKVRTTTEKYIVKGVVTSVANTTFGNIYIKDADGNELYVYGTYSADGKTRYDKMTEKPKAGDTVTLLSVITSYNGSAQMKNAWLLEHEVGEVEKPTYTTPEEILNAAYQLKSGESLGVYTLTGTIISVDTEYSTQYKNVTVTIVVAGLTDKPIQAFRLKGTGADQIGVGDEVTVTGEIINYSGTIEFNSGCTIDAWVDKPAGETPEQPETPVAGATLSFATTATRTEFSTTKQVWAAEGITVTNNKAASTSDVADYAGPARFYKNSELIIAYTGMKTIVVNCNRTQDVTNLVAVVSGATVTSSGKAVTITFAEPTDSLTLQLTSAQIRIDSIVVSK